MGNYLYDGLLQSCRLESKFAEIPGEAGNRFYNYLDVEQVSARFSNALVELGVKPGDRVAVQVPKSIEALMLYLGTVRAGAVFLPLNTAYTASEVNFFLEDAEPAVFVCDPGREAEFKTLQESTGLTLVTLGVWKNHENSAGSLADLALSLGTEFATIGREHSDLAAILYTSGTTGRSKGAMLTHANLLSNADALCEIWKFSEDDVLLHALPIFHTHGLFVATNVVLRAGASMILLPGYDVDAIVGNMPNATTMMGVPTFYTRLLTDDRLTKELVEHMRLFISGSAPLLAETHLAFENRTGHRILERYGMTETNMTTSNPYEGERRAGTVGFPLPEVEVRIAEEETGKIVPEGDIGILEVRGPNVFPGYWRMPEKTKEEFRDDGFFITGDMAKVDEDGYIQIVGRSKDLIISGGLNVYPKEIETVLDQIDGVEESAVIGVPHPDFGEAVVGVVVARQEKTIEEESILVEIKDNLAGFKRPKRVFLVDVLPRNTMGKVQKNSLRETYKNLFAD